MQGLLCGDEKTFKEVEGTEGSKRKPDEANLGSWMVSYMLWRILTQHISRWEYLKKVDIFLYSLTGPTIMYTFKMLVDVLSHPSRFFLRALYRSQLDCSVCLLKMFCPDWSDLTKPCCMNWWSLLRWDVKCLLRWTEQSCRARFNALSGNSRRIAVSKIMFLQRQDSSFLYSAYCKLNISHLIYFLFWP